MQVAIPFSSGQSFRLDAVKTERKQGYPVAIPFSSGQSFRLITLLLDEDPDLLMETAVAIPFSSGQSFRLPITTLDVKYLNEQSQSLFHQVNVSDFDTKGVTKIMGKGSQSLFHQVNLSD